MLGICRYNLPQNRNIRFSYNIKLSIRCVYYDRKISSILLFLNLFYSQNTEYLSSVAFVLKVLVLKIFYADFQIKLLSKNIELYQLYVVLIFFVAMSFFASGRIAGNRIFFVVITFYFCCKEKKKIRKSSHRTR